MIPKFATHLLQLKSHGTQHIRNVLQSTPSSSSLPWSGVGSSSSSWGSSTGAGGAKFNAGSRFYAGYTGPGRVITQATSLPAADGSNGQIDDSDERNQNQRPKPLLTNEDTRLRRRRSSVTLLSARHQVSPEGVTGQQTSSIHSQAKHAFSSEARPSGTPDGSAEGTVTKRARRNSTSAIQQETTSSELSAELPEQTTPAAQSSASAAPAQQEASAQSPALPTQDAATAVKEDSKKETDLAVRLGPADFATYNALKTAKQTGSIPKVMQEVQKLRQSSEKHSVETYNMALLAVNAVRTKGMPIAVILELYNEMLERNLTPDPMTYSNVIRALCDRDQDIHEMVSTHAATAQQSGNALNINANGPSAEHLQMLQNEENFTSAMALFNAAKALRVSHFGIETYNVLLRSAGLRGDTESAVKVYSHLEGRSDIEADMATYGHLISAYAQGMDESAAREIFDEFRAAAESGRLPWDKPESKARRVYMQVYNRMISAYFQCGEPRGAMALLEEMLGPDAKEDFKVGDVPAPSVSTYTEIIAGFCEIGDVDSAVKWFSRLCQSQHTAPRNDPYAACKIPLRPDREAWLVVSQHLTEAGRFPELQKIMADMVLSAPEGHLPLQAQDIANFLETSTAYLLSEQCLSDPGRSLQLIQGLQAILPRVASVAKLSNQRVYAHEWALIQCLINISEYSEAIASVRILMSRELDDITEAGASQVAQYLRFGLEKSVLAAAANFLGIGKARPTTPSLSQALDLLLEIKRASIHWPTQMSAALVRLYEDVREAFLQKPMRRTDFLMLRHALINVHQAAYGARTDMRPELEPYYTLLSPAPSLEVFVQDLATYMANVPSQDTFVARDLVLIHIDLLATRGRDIADSTLLQLGSIGQEAITLSNELVPFSQNRAPSTASDSATAVSSTPLQSDGTAMTSEVDSASGISEQPAPPPRAIAPRVRINFKLSNLIEAKRHHLDDPARTFQYIVNDAQRNLFVTPAALSIVMNVVGRSGELDKVKQLYAIAQKVLASFSDDKDAQTRAWFAIEDAMISSYAFAGDMDSANLHRARIIEQGGAPSAESYAVLILTVNDFTDDCNVAMALYNEAISLGVVPNVFLYNNIISKLSKARKAEAALEIFHDMKKHNVRPTSVTYGALVGACCRVGDADTAMYLFSEMTAQANFRPKAPPFNTMIQFFVHTKPDRERALHYYNLMVASNVAPSAHTYKLLMDAYGLIEPVEMNAVQIVFDQLVARKDLQVQGNHWASLITAWGCSCKDVEKAREIFESIPSHPTTLRSGTPLPDAQTWEAYINVLVTQHRFDLLGPTLESLRSSGIHMTAYIANVVIRGYAAAGDIHQARGVFEGMQDPPEGMAASYNHLNNHGTSSGEATSVDPNAPVYREPSTYEAMIRAEMGVGERDRALALLERMEARHFPPAVEARIRGLVNQVNVPEWMIYQRVGYGGMEVNQFEQAQQNAQAVGYGFLQADAGMYLEAQPAA